MKYLITTLNSKYIHTSLSVRCLYRMVTDKYDVSMCEYTINDNISYILGDIYRKKCDVICFSCYIWNYTMTLTICENLKLANPLVKIILGGPEVSYNATDILQKHSFIDAVVCGEGEITLTELFADLEEGNENISVDGLVYRDINGNVVENKPRIPVKNLDDLPFVYDDSIDEYKNKLIYYETSRGCPFSCTYCLSGEKGGVRYLSLDRVKSDMDFFIAHKVPLVKLVDRTFNANPSRAKEIFRYITANSSETRFHMELAGDLIDEEMIEILSSAPKDVFQFEIGVQTTNTQTMEAINRKIRWEPLKRNIISLIDKTDIHIHLDLIAGLPYEDIVSFAKSFNDVLGLRPHVLQLGFLKLLKGSAIRQNEADFNYRYTSNAPYEIISNDFVCYDDILHLHNIDFVLDKYYNSGSFSKTFDLIFSVYDNDYYKSFSELAQYFYDKDYFRISLSKYMLYDILHDFCKDKKIECTDELKYDYIKNVRSHDVPIWCRTSYTQDFTDKCYEVLKDEEFKKNNLSHYYDVPAKVVFKYVKFETFSDKVLLFDLKSDKEIDVTQYFI